jgi:hypothetical protein
MTETGEINETIATYEDDGKVYEIDHLGIGYDHQWGEFAVYGPDGLVAEFAIPESALKPEFRPAALPVRPDQIVELAKQAVGETAAAS